MCKQWLVELYKSIKQSRISISNGPWQRLEPISRRAALDDKAQDGQHSLGAGTSMRLIAVCCPRAGKRTLLFGQPSILFPIACTRLHKARNCRSKTSIYSPPIHIHIRPFARAPADGAVRSFSLQRSS